MRWYVLKLRTSMVNDRKQALRFTPFQFLLDLADTFLVWTQMFESFSFSIALLELSNGEAHFFLISLGVFCCGISSCNTMENTGQDPCCFLSLSEWFPLFLPPKISVISPWGQCFEKCCLSKNSIDQVITNCSPTEYLSRASALHSASGYIISTKSKGTQQFARSALPEANVWFVLDVLTGWK